MKKSNLILLLVIFAGILIIGIGYAVASNITLSVTGTAGASSQNSDFVVAFDSSVTPTKSGGVTAASIGTSDTKTATFTATLNSTTNTGTATFTIKNTSAELGANLSVKVSSKDTNTDTYFTVTPSLAATTIAAGKSTTVSVKVDLKKIPVSDVSGTFTVTVTATPKES